MALAGRVIASHYAEPLTRHLVAAAPLHDAPDGDVLVELAEGDEFHLLDCTGNWAWGYGPRRRVGYVRGDALGI